MKLLERASLEASGRGPGAGKSDKLDAGAVRKKKNGSEKAPEWKRTRRLQRQLSRKEVRAEERRTLMASKPKQKPNPRTCRRRHLAPGVKRLQSSEVCAYRRRLYARYAIRCEQKNRRLKYIPSWWRDEAERNHAITLALQ